MQSQMFYKCPIQNRLKILRSVHLNTLIGAMNCTFGHLICQTIEL